MLESYIVIGFVIAVVEIIKTRPWFKTEVGDLCVPLLVFVIAGIANVANAFVFGGTDLLSALKDGLTLGAISGGLYSMGKTYLDKSKDTTKS
jgi:hypothetical protein